MFFSLRLKSAMWAFFALFSVSNILLSQNKVDEKLLAQNVTQGSFNQVKNVELNLSQNSNENLPQDINENLNENPIEAGGLETEDKEFKKPKKLPMVVTLGDSELRFSFKLRAPDFFYGKNLRLINDANPTDQVLYFRHTLDMNLEYKYMCPSKDYDIIYSKISLRNRGVWGDAESIASTTVSEIKLVDSSVGAHSHALPRLVPWIRELWIQISLGDLLNLPFSNYHTLTFGAFPFELGRGIALGSAFAVDASDLGFFSEVNVDQYAFGGKLSGDIIENKLSYDIYSSILDSKLGNFNLVNSRIRGQQFGHRNDQARGFGIVNYLAAARLRWFSNLFVPESKLQIEPYGVYVHAGEQKIEFVGDAKSDLLTFGFALDYEHCNFEFGFDTAFNFGHQTVFGWDRNFIKLNKDKSTANLNEINSRVNQVPVGKENDPKNFTSALSTRDNQAIINRSIENQAQNGKNIGFNPNLNPPTGVYLFNDKNRFTDPYINKFRGSMFVMDMAYFIVKPDLKVAFTYGFATGDENPNRDLEGIGDSNIDGDYEGFVSLLETYSGVRVKSAFLLSGSGKIPRILSFPSDEVFDPAVAQISRFTNLQFIGSGVKWRPSWSRSKWTVNPNILAYWQEHPTAFFDVRTQKYSDNRLASPFLGTELNIFLESEPIDDLKFFLVSGLFIPGSHYDDIKGLPLNKAQRDFLDNQDVVGIVNDRIPLLGTNNAYFINFGLEYKF